MVKIWTRMRGRSEKTEKNYNLDLQTINKGIKIDENNLCINLMLIGLKMGYIDCNDSNPIEKLNPLGYLYLDEAEQKLYYSKTFYNRPKYLCDWDTSLADNTDCQEWLPTITKDGDIIFLKYYERKNPIIYPAGDYENPSIIDVENETGVKPYGFLSNRGVEQHFKDEYFCFAEYNSNSNLDNGEYIYIWKVEKPYNNPSNWKIVADDWFHQYHQEVGESEDPEHEIGHWHTCEYDFYSENWVATTGDATGHCRIIVSEDDGETWEEIVSGGGKYRTVGCIFLENGVWYGTDSGHHYLYHAERLEDDSLDWENIQQIEDLTFPGAEGSQRTYHTTLVREPYGLLFLDRAETREDGLLDTPFYSFNDEKLYNLGVYSALEDEQSNGRWGWGNMVVTPYQSIYEDGIICGANSVSRRIKMDVLNNSTENRIGLIEMKISN